MKRMPIVLICCLISLSAASRVFAVDETKGNIDWERGYIVATGFGTAGAHEPKGKARLKAQRVAEASAQRALLETIKGVRLNSETTVRNMMLEEDVITTRVEGILKGAMVTKRDVQIVDGAPVVTVEMRVCLTGGPGECASKPTLVGVLDVDKRTEPPYVPAVRYPVTVAPPPEQKAAIEPVKDQKPSNIDPLCDLSKQVTGLVLNLDGRHFEREVLPVVITPESGAYQTVYSVKSVTPGVVRTFGAVRYSDTIDNARKVSTLGENPVIITVMDITKENMVVIRAKDAAFLRETTCNGNNYLKDAKVVITNR